MAHPGARRPETRLTDSRLDRLVSVAFWTLGVLCLLNLNGLLFLWLGVERAFSALMLLCCLVLVAGLLRIRPREALGVPGMLILSCIVSYLGIGVVVAIANGAELRTQMTLYLTLYLNSLLVTFAAAIGGRLVWRRVGDAGVLTGVLIILSASCLLILASPWLLEVFRNPPADGSYRYFGSFANPNGAALVASLAVVTALALLARGRRTLIMYGALLVATAATVGTLSRTALVLLPVLGLTAILVTRSAARRRVVVGIAIVFLAAAGLQAGLDPNTLDERQVARLDSMRQLRNLSTIEDLPLAGRTTLWRLAWDEAQESPFAGTGLGRLHALENAWLNQDGKLMGAHNQYLILLGEAGIVPLLLFVSFLAVALHAGFRRRRAFWALGAVSGWALTLTLFSMTVHGVLTHRAVNFIVGLSCAAMASSLREHGSETSDRIGRQLTDDRSRRGC